MNTKTYLEKDQQEKNRNSVPNLAPGIGTRISEVCSLLGTRKNAASIAEVSTDSLQRYIREEISPTFETIARLAYAAGKSLDWIATGKEIQPSPFNVNKGHDMTSEEWSEFACIPLYDVEVSAGHGTELKDEKAGTIAFRKDWLRSKGLQKEHLATITARGDSMEPTILNGNLLLINCLERLVTADSIYVIRSDGRLYVKRLQKMYSGEIYINSDNPTYKTEVITVEKLNDLQIIGRVVWVGHEI